jgi:hypothetical protein
MLKQSRDILWSTETPEFRVEIIRGNSPQRIRLENQLLERGVPIPFASRMRVNSIREFSPTVFVSILDRSDRCVGGFALKRRRAPFVPGHHVLRAEEVGASVPLEAADTVFSALRDWISDDGRILRTTIDVFSFDDARRSGIGNVLASHGFKRGEQTSGYAETLIIDLSDDEEKLFASLHHSARRKIRQLDKHPVAVRVVNDTGLSDRMNELLAETFKRTGGRLDSADWASRIKLSLECPDISRIVGLFRTDTSGPEALLAYAWGCHSGDHVYYAQAASTRETGTRNIAVAYAVMWDLILWAKRTDARWFDMGGITRGTHADADPLGGVSDFKRYFSQKLVKVRDTYLLDNHSWKATAAGAVYRTVSRELSRVAGWLAALELHRSEVAPQLIERSAQAFLER